MVDFIKQIHFWIDGSYMDWPKNIIHTFTDTQNAINNRDINIHTTDIYSLDFYNLWEELSYNIYIHKNGKVLEIYPGMSWSGESDKEIRIAHDIRKLIIGGTFDNFFNN